MESPFCPRNALLVVTVNGAVGGIVRKEVHLLLAALALAQAKALRARFGIGTTGPLDAKEDAALRAGARAFHVEK